MSHRTTTSPLRLAAVAVGVIVAGVVLAGTASAASDQTPPAQDGQSAPTVPVVSRYVDTTDRTDALLSEVPTLEETPAETRSVPTPASEAEEAPSEDGEAPSEDGALLTLDDAELD